MRPTLLLLLASPVLQAVEIQPIERIYGGDEISLSRHAEYLFYTAYSDNVRGELRKLVHVPNLQTTDPPLKGSGFKLSPDGAYLYANYLYGTKEPRPPAFETATASSLSCHPAIGA